MSTPLFIREPVLGDPNTNGLYNGQDLSSYGSIAFDALITPAVTEATLIEEILWSAIDFSTDVGQLVLAVRNPGPLINVVGSYVIGAGTSTKWASGRIAVNLALPVGYKLFVAHNVQASSAYVYLAIQPSGGIVR